MRAGHVGGAQRRCRVAACRRRTWRHLKLEHQGHGSYAHFLPAPRRGTASRMRVSPCPARGLTKEVHELPPAPSRPRDRGNPPAVAGMTRYGGLHLYCRNPISTRRPRLISPREPLGTVAPLSLSISTRCPALRLCVQASVVWLTCLHTNLPAPSWPSPTSQEPSWSVCCCVRCRPTL